MNRYGPGSELHDVVDRVDRLFRVHCCRVPGIHHVPHRRAQCAGSLVLIGLHQLVIPHLQPALAHPHPALLPAMIVNRRRLTLRPGDSHHLEEIATVDQVAGVVAVAPKQVWLQRIGVQLAAAYFLEDIGPRKDHLRDVAELFNQIVDLA